MLRRVLSGRAILAWTIVGVATAGALVGLPGCAPLACMEWDASQGECPDKVEASQIFGAQQTDEFGCGGEIRSVDGDPSYDGSSCCYAVTYNREQQYCQPFF